MKKVLLVLVILVAILTMVACTPPYSHTVTDKLIVVKEATCAEEGIAHMFCTSCGEIVNTVSIAKTNDHTESDWMVDKKSTVETTGSQHTECTVCGVYIQTNEMPISKNIKKEKTE